MNPAELDLLRSLIGSLLHTAAAIDQLLNPEPGVEPEKPRPRYLGEDEPANGE